MKPPPAVSYAAWRRQARALVTVTVGERDWRKLFMTGRTPAEAAQYAEAYYANTEARPAGRR